MLDNDGMYDLRESDGKIGAEAEDEAGHSSHGRSRRDEVASNICARASQLKCEQRAGKHDRRLTFLAGLVGRNGVAVILILEIAHASAASLGQNDGLR